MKLAASIRVDATPEKIWRLLVDDYMQLDTWMASIDRTRPMPVKNGSSSGEMVARVADIGAGSPGTYLEETTSIIDEKNYRLVINTDLKGVPKFTLLNGYTSDIRIREISPGKCEVTWDSVASLKVHGFIFYPAMKKSLNAGFYRSREEIKHFVETGKPHPRKQKAFDRLKTLATA